MKKKAFIPISALVGALLLAIIAAMTPFVAERNLAYAQTNSDIATLSGLRVSPGTLAPAFDPANLPGGDGASGSPHLYTVNVRNIVNSLTVSATKTDRNATVAYIVNDGTPSTSGRIDLGIGNANIVVVRVTAEDATTVKFYQITVNRANSTASDDATLSELTVTPGMETSPTTLGTKFEYSVDLTNAQGSVAIEVTAEQNGDGDEGTAVVTVKKGNMVIAPAALTAIAIDEGDNTITVEILAPNFVADEDLHTDD